MQVNWKILIVMLIMIGLFFVLLFPSFYGKRIRYEGSPPESMPPPASRAQKPAIVLGRQVEPDSLEEMSKEELIEAIRQEIELGSSEPLSELPTDLVSGEMSKEELIEFIRKGAQARAADPDDELPPGLLTAVDEFVKSMESATIAFNSPTNLNIEDTAQIQLLLSLSEKAEALERTLTAFGERSVAEVKVCNRMEARLTGYMFQITAITPEEQAVSHHESTEWRWEIHPKEVGRHQLHLTLTALFELDGIQTQKAIRTFDRTIIVDVTGSQRIADFVKGNWQWLWAVIFLPVGGWLWKNRKRLSDKLPRN